MFRLDTAERKKKNSFPIPVTFCCFSSIKKQDHMALTGGLVKHTGNAEMTFR